MFLRREEGEVMERCPKCLDYTLSFDPMSSTAVCNSYHCDFEQNVQNQNQYFKRYVITELNWNNYCAQTPTFVRKLRGTLAPA